MISRRFFVGLVAQVGVVALSACKTADFNSDLEVQRMGGSPYGRNHSYGYGGRGYGGYGYGGRGYGGYGYGGRGYGYGSRRVGHSGSFSNIRAANHAASLAELLAT